MLYDETSYASHQLSHSMYQPDYTQYHPQTEPSAQSTVYNSASASDDIPYGVQRNDHSAEVHQYPQQTYQAPMSDLTGYSRDVPRSPYDSGYGAPDAIADRSYGFATNAANHAGPQYGYSDNRPSVSDDASGYLPHDLSQTIPSNQYVVASQRVADVLYADTRNPTLEQTVKDPIGNLDDHSDSPAHGFQAVYDPYSVPTEPTPTKQVSDAGLPRRLADDSQRPAIPVAKFTFNGKLMTCFPQSSSQTSTYGAPYSEASSSSAAVKLQRISELLPNDASLLEAFPGPLYQDQSASSASAKTKKRRDVLAWLDSRVEEANLTVNYIGAGGDTAQRYEAEGKAVLLRVIKALLENDGRLHGR